MSYGQYYLVSPEDMNIQSSAWPIIESLYKTPCPPSYMILIFRILTETLMDPSAELAPRRQVADQGTMLHRKTRLTEAVVQASAHLADPKGLCSDRLVRYV